MAPRKLTLEDYTITKDGQIINSTNGKILKGQQNNKGYLKVTIGGQKYFIHRLVAQKYLDNPYNKEQINHKDGNKLNNCVENLEWVTNFENRKHAVQNKLHLCGENCPWAKLTQINVDQIRDNKILSIKELANKFCVSKSTINDILKYRTWKNS